MVYGSGGQSSDPEQLLADRYRQLLGYIAELDRLRSRTVLSVFANPDWLDLSERPAHPSISWKPEEPSAFLKVVRCVVPPSPPCPDALRPWVVIDSNQSLVEPTRLGMAVIDGQEQTWEEANLDGVWESWIESWRTWTVDARPAIEARELYTRLYDLRAVAENNSEQVELVAADVSVAIGPVDHPILINPIRIDFDPERSTITVGCLDEPTQIFGDAVRTALPECGQAIGRAREEVAENADLWAFGGTDVDLLAKRFVESAHKDGVFLTDEDDVPTGVLSARRSPYLILRTRVSGLSELAEGLLRKFEQDGEVPHPIQPILVDRVEEVREHSLFLGEPDEDELSFFTKPANHEQLEILRNYRRSRRVHVQGPPGTGKTHTIANLIGHFLAEGKSVLVTSEKPQALSVLREKVVEELRPLCISLVGTDRGEGLKVGMRALQENLHGTTPEQLEAQVQQFEDARRRLIGEIKAARDKMRTVLAGEHTPVDVDGWRGTPSEAAQFLREEGETLGWIPGGVTPGSQPPLTETEWLELKELLENIEAQVAEDVRKPLPPVEEIPTPEQLRSVCARLDELKSVELKAPAIPLKADQRFSMAPEHAERILADVEVAIARYSALAGPYRELANRVVEAPRTAEMWADWIGRAKALLDEETTLIAQQDFAFQVNGQRAEILQAARGLLSHVEESRKPQRKPRLLNGQDKLLFSSVTSARPLGEQATLEALVRMLEHGVNKERLAGEVVAGGNLVGLTFSGEQVELELSRDAWLVEALQWESQRYQPIVALLSQVGLGHEAAEQNRALAGPAKGAVEFRVWWLDSVVRPILHRAVHRFHQESAQATIREYQVRAQDWLAAEGSEALRSLGDALGRLDLDKYARSYEEVSFLRATLAPVLRRDELLTTVSGSAPQLASELRSGSLTVDRAATPLHLAWNYAKVRQELDERHGLDLQVVKRQLDELKRQLDGMTVRLASARAWQAQHKRVTQPVQSALSRYHQAQSRLGKQKGRRVPELLTAMRNAMRDAKDAFPVWIMPLYDVAKSFDFAQTKFDVVIVDEASQLSAVGLILLLIADTAIVVGDDEQTEPSLAGVPLDSVSSLMNEHLTSFQDRVLWSPETSLYSFASRFSATVGLREHFRCVPEIIAFSSGLSYDWEIKPLRDARGVGQVPHVVPIAVDPAVDANDGRDENRAEAIEIASLILACCEMPEYAGQTFGAIALRGSANAKGRDTQTDLIESYLRLGLGSGNWEAFVRDRHFRSGVPAMFQGDERDVVFLSVGDRPADAGLLRIVSADALNGRLYKKKVNVAASRARNQLWVVHSFRNYEADLKAGDIRKELMDFAYAPQVWLEKTLATNPKAESPFEQAVYAELVRAGYVVNSQVAVGKFRIDLVVEDPDARVALECDGDAFHQDPVADLSRQLVLERCGWRFVRVRGSEWYRNPEAALSRIQAELADFGVTPGHEQPEQAEPEGALLARIRQRAAEIRAELKVGRAVALDLPPTVVVEADGVDEPDSLEADFEVPTVGALSVEPVAPPIAPSSDELAPYVCFEGQFPDPKECSLQEVQEALLQILAVEGPAVEAVIVERYRVAIGYGRLKGPTREKVNAALRAAVEQNRVVRMPDGLDSDTGVYSLAGQPTVRIRERGPREFGDIPLSEIAARFRSLASVADVDAELFHRTILGSYGLQRLTSGAQARIKQAIDLMR